MSGFKLKLNLNTGVSKAPSLSTPSASTPLVTPIATPGGSRPKLKLTNSSVPPTPASAISADNAAKPKKTKAGRATKPSAKIIESRKRVKEENESEEEEEGSTINVQPPTKKLKIQFKPALKVPPTPVVLKAKVKGKPPKRPPGEGYDSEASDKEDDPTIEEEFILRMVPGDDCDYLRQAINDKKIGVLRGPPHYGADVQMKFFTGDGRRALITIRNHFYAATLVDLPCVIEGMKSWDRRGLLKSADICQMLWVFAPVKSEEEAKNIPLPAIIDPKTAQYPHGLTPPMHFARKRRFRNRLHKTEIEAVEDAVEKLLQADEEAESVTHVWIDPDGERRTSRAYSGASSPEGYEIGGETYSDDEDAEGEVDDYFGQEHTNGHAEDSMDADLEADLEAAMEAEEFEAATPMSTAMATPSMANGTETPAIEEDEDEDSGDESIEDGDEDDDQDGDEIDEEEKARLAQIQGTKEDIAELEKKIAEQQVNLTMTHNPILRKRVEENLRKLKQELQLKKSSIEEGEENE